MTMDIATLGIRVDATEARLAAIELEKLSTAGGKTAQSMSAVEKAMQGLTGMVSGIGFGMLAKSILDTNREMESLRASLKSVTGSAQGAQAAFNSILTFAKDTPYEVKGLTQTFIMLQNMGIKPTQKVMQSLTDQASKLGGSQEDLTSIALQLGQAHSKGKLQMEDMVVLMQRGVPVMRLLGEITNKNAAELSEMSAKGTITIDMIDQLIVKMGEAAAGSNANAMETLNGKISSLSDAWHTFEDALLNDKSEGFLKKIVTAWTIELDVLTALVNKSSDNQLEKMQGTMEFHQNLKKLIAMSPLGYFIKPSQDESKGDLAKIEQLKAEAAAQEALLNSKNKEKVVLGESLQAKKEHEKAAKAAARAEASLAKSFDDTITSLSLNIVEQSQSKRQLEEATLASKLFNKAQIEQVMVLWDAKEALEAKKKLHEAEKAQLDSLIDRYNKATMSARDYYSSTLTVTSPDGIKSPMSGADKAPLLAQFDKTTVAEDASKTHEAAKTALDAYNTSLDDAKTKTQDLGAITSSIFDGALGGISLLTGAFTAMTDEITKNTTEMTRLNEEKQKISDFKPQGLEEEAAKFKAAKKNTKELSDLDKKSVQDQMTGARQIAGAASKMFAEKSAGAKAFHAIEVGIAIAQLAMRAKDMAEGAIATAKNIAEGASKFFAQTGWWGFAGVAAMLALMAGLGAMASGGGGGGSSGPPPSNADTGTGTVLGDPAAVSESIAHTNDLLKSIHAEEYIELRAINKGIQTLQGNILSAVTKEFQLGSLTGTSAPNLGKSGHTMVGGGMQTGAILMSDILAGMEVVGQMYTTDAVKKTKKGKTTFTYEDFFSPMDKSLNESLTKVFKSIGTVMSETGSLLGKDIGVDFSEKINSAVIPALKIDTMSMTGEEAVARANAVISSMLDDLSMSVFGDVLKQYQQLGEGMLETTIRIVAEIAIVRDALKQSGLSITTDVIAVSDALVQAAGGLEEFQKQFEAFFDRFYTDAEKQTRLQKTLSGSLVEANLLLPATRDGYRQLVEALNLSNPLDQQRYSLLLELSDAADNYYSALEDGSKSAMDALTKSVSSAMAVLQKAVAAEKTALTKAYNENIASTQLVITNLTAAVTKLTSLSNMLKNSLKGMSVAGSEATNRATAQEFIADSLRIAQSGQAGSIDEAKLNDALGVIARPSEMLFSTFEDYQRDFLKTAISVSNLSDNLASETSKAVSQLDVAKSQLEVLKDTYAAENLRLDEIIRSAQEQIDAVNGTTVAVMTVTDAIVSLTAAILAMKQMQTPAAKIYTEGATASGYQSSGGASYDAATKNISFKDNTVFAASQVVKTVTDAIAAGHPEQIYAAAIAKGVSAVSLDLLMGWEKGTSNKWAEANNLPKFAAGGQHEGGWRMVGEKGPELEHTGASRIFSNPQSKSLLNMDELLAEMKALRSDVRAGQEAIANNTRKTAKILQDVTQDGQSITTSVAA